MWRIIYLAKGRADRNTLNRLVLCLLIHRVTWIHKACLPLVFKTCNHHHHHSLINSRCHNREEHRHRDQWNNSSPSTRLFFTDTLL